jgi:SAM-dependent methyltransferase
MFRNIIASHFRKPAGPLGMFTSNLMIKGNKNNYSNLIKNLNLQANDNLLEIGYGPGIGIHMICESCDSCTIHGVDFSRLMYKKASRYNKTYIDQKRVTLQYGDFLNIPIDQGKFDKVFCLNVIYFWNELEKPFSKILSDLREGGGFLIYMAAPEFLKEKKAPDSIFNKHSIEHVTGILKLAGFSRVEYYSDKGYYIHATK